MFRTYNDRGSASDERFLGFGSPPPITKKGIFIISIIIIIIIIIIITLVAGQCLLSCNYSTASNILEMTYSFIIVCMHVRVIAMISLLIPALVYTWQIPCNGGYV